MLTINEFLPDLVDLLPETQAILADANLTVHDAVIGVNLAGSRGLAGGYRPDSDVDLTLIVDAGSCPLANRIARIGCATCCGRRSMRGAARSISTRRRFSIRATAAGCAALISASGTTRSLRGRGIDCFGIYKIQRGFDGYVTQGVELARMYPMLPIWRR